MSGNQRSTSGLNGLLTLRNHQSEQVTDLRDLEIVQEIADIMKPKTRSRQFGNFYVAPSRTKNPLAKNIQFAEADDGMDPFYEKLKKKSIDSLNSSQSLSTNESEN